MNVFDITGPLPCSPTVLEASAGTGKTYTIAGLACRYLAEQGRDIRDLLLITFGNAASNELRERLFERLVDTERDLGAYLDDGLVPEDAVSRRLCSPEAASYRERIREAVRRFDEATVVTTHAFCRTMLRDLGILGDHDPAERLVPEPLTLIAQCASDQYLQDVGHEAGTDGTPLDPKTAMGIGQEACRSPLPLHPADSPGAAFGERVRRRFAARTRELGVVTYDDLIARLHDALKDRVTGDAATRALRERYPVVLVDEFQDTDPLQWAIIERAFVAAGRPTILVGDPKQSIYGFRNADVLSYLKATGRAEHRLTLGTNFRSDEALTEGVGALFGTVELGDPRITVGRVESKFPGTRLRLASPQARVWIRGGRAEQLTASPAEAIAEDLIGQVRRLLAEGRIDVEPGETRPVGLGDIVVLTRQRRRAEQLCRRLIEAGHPAVLMGQQSLWFQEAAQEWLTLLRAMLAPEVSSIRKAALTDLIGTDLADLVDPTSPAAAEASALIRELGRHYAAGGIAQAFSTLRLRTRLDARLLSTAGGERRLTDLVHVAELLSEQCPVALETLIAWLEARIQSPAEAEEAPLRAEQDADAIRLMTIHAAKGLEFPIVALPETSRTMVLSYRPFPLIEGERRVLYVGAKPSRASRLHAELTRQLRDEELRLLYVGLTRAQHLAIAWHVDDDASDTSPMSALLYRDPRTPQLAPRYLPAGLRAGLDSGLVHLDRLDPTPRPRHVPPPSGARPHAPRVFTREIDATWRRTSYTGLTQALHDASPTLGDEPAMLEALPGDPGLAAVSPMAGLPAGAAFGTLVHAALERLDWSPERLAADAVRVAATLGPQSGLTAEQCTVLAASLDAVCRTPLSPLTEATLSELGTAARLAELDFDLPLAEREGSRPATVGDLTTLMARHLPAVDPLNRYPARLAATEAASGVLNGFLTGSIDAVLRTPEGRFLVVDYKTNTLSPSSEAPQILGHYTPEAMAEAMMQAHYPLQALLYSAALHRYLRLRLPGYRPERHLGGVGYLFVRGMAGAGTPVVSGARCGVFSWYPPPELVVATSELLGGVG